MSLEKFAARNRRVNEKRINALHAKLLQFANTIEKEVLSDKCGKRSNVRITLHGKLT